MNHIIKQKAHRGRKKGETRSGVWDGGKGRTRKGREPRCALSCPEVPSSENRVGNVSHVLGVWEKRLQGVLQDGLDLTNVGGPGHRPTEIWGEVGLEVWAGKKGLYECNGMCGREAWKAMWAQVRCFSKRTREERRTWGQWSGFRRKHGALFVP